MLRPRGKTGSKVSDGGAGWHAEELVRLEVAKPVELEHQPLRFIVLTQLSGLG